MEPFTFQVLAPGVKEYTTQSQVGQFHLSVCIRTELIDGCEFRHRKDDKPAVVVTVKGEDFLSQEESWWNEGVCTRVEIKVKDGNNPAYLSQYIYSEVEGWYQVLVPEPLD